MSWITKNKKGELLLALHIQPGSAKARVAGLYGERLKIAVAAPPVAGKANKDVVKFLAKVFAVPVKNIAVIRGQTSRQKTVSLRGISEEEVRKRMAEFLA